MKTSYHRKRMRDVIFMKVHFEYYLGLMFEGVYFLMIKDMADAKRNSELRWD